MKYSSFLCQSIGFAKLSYIEIIKQFKTKTTYVCDMRTYCVYLIVKRIVAKSTLVGFWTAHPTSKAYLQTWYETARKADWKNPDEIKSFYSTVSILKNSRVVFNIKGNDFRLVVKIQYKKSWIFIRFIGTHQEYNKIDINTI